MGRIDNAIMRFCDIFLTFPTFVLAMFMVGVLGTGIVNVILAISLSHWAWYARIARGLVLSLKERDYVLAARVAGGTRFGVFLTHILPSVLVQFVVLCTLDIGHMILHVAGLSFLGLGVMPPTPEWGVMINDAREFIWTQPMLMAWPGLMIFGTVMAFNQLGDALRDRLDPDAADGDRLAMAKTLAVDGLSIVAPRRKTTRTIVHDLSFTLTSGRVLALVGASGSGKSATCLGMQDTLPPGLRRTGGSLKLDGTPMPFAAIRGRIVATVLQNPRTAFNPVLKHAQATAGKSCCLVESRATPPTPRSSTPSARSGCPIPNASSACFRSR